MSWRGSMTWWHWVIKTVHSHCIAIHVTLSWRCHYQYSKLYILQCISKLWSICTAWLYGLAPSSVVTLTQSQRDILCSKIDGKMYEGILTTRGVEWKMRRSVLSPAFSGNKIKLVSLVQQPLAIYTCIYSQTFNANSWDSTSVLVLVILISLSDGAYY